MKYLKIVSLCVVFGVLFIMESVLNIPKPIVIIAAVVVGFLTGQISFKVSVEREDKQNG